MPGGAAPTDSGIWLALFTESFAVRALLGSLAAAALTALAVRVDLVHSTRARRLLVLAPVLTAAVAGIATAREASAVYLPQLYLTTSGAAGSGDDLLELINELRLIGLSRRLDLLVPLWAFIVGVLLLRRVAGAVVAQRLVHSGTTAQSAHRRVVDLVARLAPAMGLAVPRVVLIADCPGGAFARGLVRGLIAVDPALVDTLDEHELEGLVAHELAHLSRRDPLLCLVVGLFRDVTFFLPSVHVAARWLYHEQEESADAVAASVTTRPIALASGILKVWNRASVGPQVACGAVPSPSPVLAFPVGTVWNGRGLSEAARIVQRRVERLIADRHHVSQRRRAAEVTLAGGVLAIACVSAISVPQWIVDRWGASMLAMGNVPAVTASPEESEVFRTFAHLTRDTAVATSAPAAAPASGGRAGGCPCVETQAQLRAGVTATADTPERRLVWLSQGRLPHEIRGSSASRMATARSLWTLSDSGAQVGVFLVQRPDTVPANAS